VARPANSSSSGGSSAGQATFRPMPTTTTARAWAGSARYPAEMADPAGQSASASTPASLRSSTTRSFGHLSPATTPVVSSTASAMARAAAIVVPSATGAGGRSRTDTSSEPPGGATHVRSRRPRPAVWWSATTTMPSGAPSRASARASALVEPVSATQRTSANREPGGTVTPRGRSPSELAPSPTMPVNI
jgi:hypothetical protein